jgi:hypothetical protein
MGFRTRVFYVDDPERWRSDAEYRRDTMRQVRREATDAASKLLVKIKEGNRVEYLYSCDARF